MMSGPDHSDKLSMLDGDVEVCLLKIYCTVMLSISIIWYLDNAQSHTSKV